MGTRVLIAIDDSPQAREALEHALAYHADDELLALTVIDPGDAGYEATAGIPSFSEEWYESAKYDARERLHEATAVATEAGVDLSTDFEVGPPANTIVSYAEEHDVDQIIVGSHGRSGISRIIVGSVAEAVIRRSPVPVTVVR